MKEEINRFGSFKRASKFDLAHGFIQCRLAQSSQEHGTWRATEGLMIPTRLFPGLSPAAGEFCNVVQTNLIDRMPEPLRSEVPRYFDDFGHGTEGDDDFDAQGKEITAVFAILDAVIAGGHVCKLRKCVFVVTSLLFCGSQLSAGQRSPAPARTQAIVNFGEVKTKLDVRRLLALGEPWRTSIRGYASLTAPLREFARGRGPLGECPGLRQAEAVFKRKLCNAPATAIADRKREFFLRTDASDLGLGSILEQRNKVVAYWGRPLKPSERNLYAYDKEWISIVEGLEALDSFFGGAFVHVTSDHETLGGIEDPEGRELTPLRSALIERSRRFTFDVQYKPRTDIKQKAADAITKSPSFREARDKELAGVVRPESSVSSPAHAVIDALPKITYDGTVPSPFIAALTAITPVRTDAATWRERQLRDPVCAAFIAFKETSAVPAGDSVIKTRSFVAQAQFMHLVDGALYHVASRRGESPVQLVVPDVDGIRQRLIKDAHVLEGAHESGLKMFERMSRMFWWDKLLDGCVSFHVKCDSCISHKEIRNKYGFLDPTTSAKLKGAHRLAFDLAGPFQVTAEGNTHLVIGFDYDSGRPYAVPIKDIDVLTIMKAIKNNILINTGVPTEVITDRGSNLMGDVAQKIYDAYGIDKYETTSHNPQADGAAEAAVKLISGRAAVLVEAKGGQWDEHIGELIMALHSMWKLPFKVSPFMAEHGREMVLPSYFEQPLSDADIPAVRDLKSLHIKLSERRDEAAAEMKVQYDKGREAAAFAAGDLVWIRNHDPVKLEKKRIGPFRVEKVTSPLNVRIADIAQGPKLGTRHPVVNVKHVAPYNGDLAGARPDDPVPDKILKHKYVKRKRGKQSRYQVKWIDGDDTWEPVRNLIDEADDGPVFTDALVAWWSAHPDHKAHDGY